MRKFVCVCAHVDAVLLAFYITGLCVNFQGHSVLPPVDHQSCVCCRPPPPPVPSRQGYLQNNTAEKS